MARGRNGVVMEYPLLSLNVGFVYNLSMMTFIPEQAICKAGKGPSTNTYQFECSSNYVIIMMWGISKKVAVCEELYLDILNGGGGGGGSHTFMMG